MLLARLGDRGRTVALGHHHERAAGRLELVDVGVHPASRRRPEGAARVASRGLRRACVVDREVAQVVGHRLAGVEPLLDLRVRDVTGDDHRAGQREPGLHRILRQLLADLRHRPGQVDVHDVVRQVLVGDVGQVLRRIVLQAFEEDTVGGDAAERLAVGAARHSNGDGA